MRRRCSTGQQGVAPGDGRPVQFVDVVPKTPDAKVHLFPTTLETRHGLYHYEPDPATARYPLSLISPASEHTVSSTLGELRPGIARVKIHPDDCARARRSPTATRYASSTIWAKCTARRR